MLAKITTTANDDDDDDCEQVTLEMTEESDRMGRERAIKVKEAMQHAWKGYKDYAYGADELSPRGKRPKQNFGGMGVTLVDSLGAYVVRSLLVSSRIAPSFSVASLSASPGLGLQPNRSDADVFLFFSVRGGSQRACKKAMHTK